MHPCKKERKERRMKMASSSPVNLAPVLILVWLISSPPLISCDVIQSSSTPLKFKGGPLLTGKLDLSILFYGQTGRAQKRAVRTFLKSLNHGGGAPQPRVSSWWETVESYQSLTNQAHTSPNIVVDVVSQITDKTYSLGKVLTIDFIKMLVKTATEGKPHAGLVVIFTGKECAVSSLCRGKCYDHGVIGDQAYLIVGNPEIECPGACAWPFLKASYGPPSTILKPPNGSPIVDAILVNFAAGLAAAVTNPMLTGFSKPGPKTWALEACTACEGMFGSGSSPGNPGKVAIDEKSGGGFNANGVNGVKFLLPALWNPRTSSCWTPM